MENCPESEFWLALLQDLEGGYYVAPVRRVAVPTIRASVAKSTPAK